MPRLLQGLTQLEWLSLAGNELSADETMDRVSLTSHSGDHWPAAPAVSCHKAALPLLALNL